VPDHVAYFRWTLLNFSIILFRCEVKMSLIVKKNPRLFTRWKFTAIASSLCRFVPPVLKIIAFVTVRQKLIAYTLLESSACVHTAVAADYSGKNELCLCIYVVVVFSFILKLSHAI